MAVWLRCWTHSYQVEIALGAGPTCVQVYRTYLVSLGVSLISSYAYEIFFPEWLTKVLHFTWVGLEITYSF